MSIQVSTFLHIHNVNTIPNQNIQLTLFVAYRSQVNVHTNVWNVRKHSSTNIIWPSTNAFIQARNHSNVANVWSGSRIQDRTASTWTIVIPTANHTESKCNSFRTIQLIDLKDLTQPDVNGKAICIIEIWKKKKTIPDKDFDVQMACECNGAASKTRHPITLIFMI